MAQVTTSCVATTSNVMVVLTNQASYSNDLAVITRPQAGTYLTPDPARANWATYTGNVTQVGR